jgi:hypothetical protein
VRSLAYQFVHKVTIKNRFNHDNQKARYNWLDFFLERNNGRSIRKSKGLSVCRIKAMLTEQANIFSYLLSNVYEDKNFVNVHEV